MPTPGNPEPPQLPAAEEPVAADWSPIEHDGLLAEFTASDCAAPDQIARGISVASGRLHRVNLNGSAFDEGHFTDLVLDGCDLANLRCRRANLTRVRIEGGRLTGMALLDSVLYDVVFQDCRIDLSSFATSKLVRVRFEDCHLGGIGLMDTQCESVTFEDCRMTEADFRGAHLKNCQIRRCDLAGIEGISGLRGVAMEWGDIIDMAPTWAAALGIEVIDLEDNEKT